MYAVQWGWGWAWWWIWWAFIVFLIILLVATRGGRRYWSASQSAEAILKIRYARGEISREEYQQMLRDIRA